MAVKQALERKVQSQVANTNNKPKTLKQLIEAMTPQIERALPSVMTAERFTRIVLTAVSSNPQLAACTQDSFLGAMMNAAQAGLEPNTPLGQAYIIPFKDHGVPKAQYQIGYRGMLTLAYRSGEFKNIDARVVYENDQFEYEYGLEPKLLHKPAMSNRGKPVYYYAVYTLVNGGFGFEVMSVEDVQEHRRKYSKAKNSPWNTNFNAMAKKTCIKRVLKYAPLSTEFTKMIMQDETIKSTISPDMSEIADETDWNAINELEEAEAEIIEEPEPEPDPEFEPIPEDDLPFSVEPEHE